MEQTLTGKEVRCCFLPSWCLTPSHLRCAGTDWARHWAGRHSAIWVVADIWYILFLYIYQHSGSDRWTESRNESRRRKAFLQPSNGTFFLSRISWCWNLRWKQPESHSKLLREITGSYLVESKCKTSCIRAIGHSVQQSHSVIPSSMGKLFRSDEKTAQYLGIEGGSVLHLVLALRGGRQ